MTDAPSNHDDWYQPEDALSADRGGATAQPVSAPALAAASPGLRVEVRRALVPPAPLASPTLAPPSDPSTGLRGLMGSLTPSLDRAVEPSLGLSVEPLSAVVEGTVDDPPSRGVAADRVMAALSAVPIERLAPLSAVAFVCSVLLFALVRVLF
jgi:hypothetical protein